MILRVAWFALKVLAGLATAAAVSYLTTLRLVGPAFEKRLEVL